MSPAHMIPEHVRERDDAAAEAVANDLVAGKIGFDDACQILWQRTTDPDRRTKMLRVVRMIEQQSGRQR